MKKINAGSKAFFKTVKEGSDTDYLIISKDMVDIHKHVKSDDGDLFYWKDTSKEEILRWHLFESEDPMAVLSLIVPEFIEHYGFTLEELELVFSKATTFTKRPWGEKVFEYYIVNRGFYLTEEQLDDVYEIYQLGMSARKRVNIDRKLFWDNEKELINNSRMGRMFIPKKEEVIEVIEEPKETDKEREIRELEAKLAALRG